MNGDQVLLVLTNGFQCRVSSLSEEFTLQMFS